LACAIACLLFVCHLSAFGEVGEDNDSSTNGAAIQEFVWVVLDGNGTCTGEGVVTNYSSSGQAGGVQVSSGGDYVNQAGFLSPRFSGAMPPPPAENVGGNETDGEAPPYDLTVVLVTNENDAVSGASVDSPDQEADGGNTSPVDAPSATLIGIRLTGVTVKDDGVVLLWQSHGIEAQRFAVFGVTDLNVLDAASEVAWIDVAGGDSPHFDLTGSVTVPYAEGVRFYILRAVP